MGKRSPPLTLNKRCSPILHNHISDEEAQTEFGAFCLYDLQNLLCLRCCFALVRKLAARLSLHAGGRNRVAQLCVSATKLSVRNVVEPDYIFLAASLPHFDPVRVDFCCAASSQIILCISGALCSKVWMLRSISRTCSAHDEQLSTRTALNVEGNLIQHVLASLSTRARGCCALGFFSRCLPLDVFLPYPLLCFVDLCSASLLDSLLSRPHRCCSFWPAASHWTVSVRANTWLTD